MSPCINLGGRDGMFLRKGEKGAINLTPTPLASGASWCGGFPVKARLMHFGSYMTTDVLLLVCLSRTLPHLYGSELAGWGGDIYID